MISKREVYFEKDTPFHITSRAIEGRKIFTKEDDCCRFIFQMYAANIGTPGANLHRQDIKKAAYALLNGEEIPSKFVIIQHLPLVDFLSFALTINHHHFCLVQNIEGGISKLLHKGHDGFARYFNLKYGRRDTLFERQYGIVPIESNFQLDAVIRYVNVKNPLDVYQPNWKKRGVKNEKEALDFLENYPFSSFPDLFGERKSKILAPQSKLEKYLGEEIIGGRANFISFIKDYRQEKLISYNSLFLEEE